MVVRAGAAKPDIGTVDAFRRTLVDAKSIAYSDSGSGIYLSTTPIPQAGRCGSGCGQEPQSGAVRPRASRLPRSLHAARRMIGFQQVSELIHEPGVDFVGAIPSELQPVTFFSAALASSPRHKRLPRRSYRIPRIVEGGAAIAKAGLAPLAAQ
jgi:molybdate transport system substrate-binding protein